MYKFIKNMYTRGKMNAAQVWAAADGGKITPEEAERICGPRREREP